jgi:hypothetical protein
MIPKQTWISDDFWYVSLSTGIVSFVWKSYNDWTGEEEDSYSVRNQLAFLEKSAVDSYISSLQEVKDEKPLYSGEEKTLDDSVEKKILIFVKESVNPDCKVHTTQENLDSSQTKATEEQEPPKPPLSEAVLKVIQEYSSAPVTLHPQERLWLDAKLSIPRSEIIGKKKAYVVGKIHLVAQGKEKCGEYKIMKQPDIKQALDADPDLDNKIVIIEDFNAIANLIRPIRGKIGNWSSEEE